MTTGRINQGASCVRSTLAVASVTRARYASVDGASSSGGSSVERAPGVVLLPPVFQQAGRRHSVV